MQTTNLQNPLSTNAASANGRNAASNNASNSANNASQFSAMLSNEMEARVTPDPAPTPAPAPAPQAAKPATPAQSADGADDAAASADADAAKPADAASTTKADGTDAAKDSDAADDKDADDSAAAKAGDPAAAMLALMASLKQAGQGAGAKSANEKAFDALGGGKGKRTDAAQLNALQTALKTTAKDAGTDVSGAKTTTLAADAKDALSADLGATTAVKSSADNAFSAALGAVKADAKAGLDTAELGLQQTRDAAALLAAQKEPAAIAVAQAQAQPAVFEAAQAAAASSDTLTANVGTDDWNDQVGQKIVYMVGSEDQTAELTLNPPDLGPVQIVLSVSNDQASVTFSSNQEEVRQALENALPRLREMMSESGIALGNATVDSGNSGNNGAQDGSGSNRSGNGRRNTMTDNAEADPTVRTVTRTIAVGNGAVDTFA